MDELFPYQEEGALWLAGRSRALLADEMGLGKTAQAITACDILNARKVLVLCPAVARPGWVEEFGNFSILSRSIAPLVERAAVTRLRTDVVVCSYDLATTNSVNGFLRDSVWDVLILDEAHYLKSPDAKRTASVFGKNGIARCARNIWALTGTPAPNHAGDLWIICRAYGATALTYDQWVERYCTYFIDDRGERRVTGTRYEMIPELKALMATFMLRRLKRDVMQQLPPITYGELIVEPGAVDMDFLFPDQMLTGREEQVLKEIKYQRELVETCMEFSEHNEKASARAKLEALAHLERSSATYRRFVGMQKVEPIAKLVNEELSIGAYEKIVIFAQHRAVIEGLRRLLTRHNPVTIYGGTDPDKRVENIRKFQKNPRCKVFIGNIIAAGTNITLTAAHEVLLVEADWVPGNNAQAVMRCHRIGQEYPVNVRFVMIAGDVDMKVQRVLKRKTKELTALLDD